MKKKENKMTCIELFDKNDTDNICSLLGYSPNKVVFLGRDGKIPQNIDKYKRIFKERNLKTDFVVETLSSNDVEHIVERLSLIIEKNENEPCIIDITGGEDTYLVSVGIVLEKYKGRVQAHRINARDGRISDCDCDGVVFEGYVPPKITFEENIMLYDGLLNYKSDYYEWDFSEDFLLDLEKMWRICVSDSRKWNIQLSYLCLAKECECDDLTVSVSRGKLDSHYSQRGISEKFDVGFLKRLDKAGLFDECFCDKKVLKLKFKNQQIKRCLTKSGQVLELKIFYSAKSLKENGEPYYSDALTGVFITWDNNVVVEPQSVKNEIDVVLMKGLVPVFISCKNGSFSSDELYKLSSIADKFGGKYAKKVLITTSVEHAKNMKPRAKEYKINIVCFDKNTSDEKFIKAIKGLWRISG